MMKIRIVFLVLVIGFVCSFANADTYTYTETVTKDIWVDIAGSGPDLTPISNILDFGFPDGGSGEYANGVFEFDDYSDNIETFNITMTGDGGYFGGAWDGVTLFISMDGGTSWTSLGTDDIQKTVEFTMTWDLLNKTISYHSESADYTRDIASGDQYDLDNFLGKDSFKLAYGCHFWHRSTVFDVAVSDGGTPVPEPLTIVLFVQMIVALFIRKKMGH